MTATTVQRDTPRKFHILSLEDERGVAADAVIKAGWQIALNAGGYIVPVTAATTLKILGRSNQDVDNTGGDDGALTCKYSEGVFPWVNLAGDEVDVDDVGEVVWGADNQSIAKTDGGGTRSPSGVLLYVNGGVPYVASGLHIAALMSQSVDLTTLENDLDTAEASIVLLQAGAIQERTVVITHADLTAAGTTETESIGAVLPAGDCDILSVSVILTTPFSGITGPVTVDIGTSGDVDALRDGSNLTDAAVGGQASTCPLGIAPHKRFSAAEQLIATFLSASGNLVDCSAGSVTFVILFRVTA